MARTGLGGKGMKHRNSHLLVGYWSRLRRGRPVPDQSEIDPRALKRMLPSLLILDASEVTRPLYRLAGTQLCERHGAELRGTNFLAGWEVRSRRALSEFMCQSLQTHQPLCLSSLGTGPRAGVVEMEILLAPLSFGGSAATRFIGMVQILGDSAAFADKQVAFQRLMAAQMVQEDEPLVVGENAFAAAPRRHVQGPAHPRAPYLRLVVDRATAPHGARGCTDPDGDIERLIRTLYAVRPQTLAVPQS